MELTSWMKLARFQTFWIQMRKNEHLDENRETDQTSGAKMTFYSLQKFKDRLLKTFENKKVLV
ncbi:hypothetical protein Hanom_Chr01g00009291 [Helianthus anomalus]